MDRELTEFECELLKRSSYINNFSFDLWTDPNASSFSSRMFQDPYDYELPSSLLEKHCYFEDPYRVFGSVSIIEGAIDPFCVRQVRLFFLSLSPRRIACRTARSSPP